MTLINSPYSILKQSPIISPLSIHHRTDKADLDIENKTILYQYMPPLFLLSVSTFYSERLCFSNSIILLTKFNPSF